MKILKSDRKGEETKFNKEYGVYYTPREIVHYMCQQSLINYLSSSTDIPVCDIEKFIKLSDSIQELEQTATVKKEQIEKGEIKSTRYESQIPESIKNNAKRIDALLADIKVCDPAVGSGAFPIGMMHEIVKLRQLLSVYTGKNITPYDLKRHCIENSFYGVDIDPGAVEICKLRFWLSMIVDEEDFYNIKPLPNLDYKVVCGNSLLGVEKDLFNSDAFAKLEKLKPQYFNETNPTKKQQLKNEIDKLIYEITKGHKEFDFEVYFSEVFHHKGGFDIVIANPPYGFLSGKESPVKKLKKAGRIEEANNLRDLIKKLKSSYKNSSQGCLDWYKWFIERGYQLTKVKGILTYITSNTFIVYDKFADIRCLILEKMENKLLIDLGFDIFDEPTIPTAIFLSIKSKGNGIAWYSDLKEIPRNILKNKRLETFLAGNVSKVSLDGGRLKIFKHPIAQKIYSTFTTSLKDFVIIREGEHSLNNDFTKVVKKSLTSIPVIKDDEVKRFYVPIVYLPKSMCKKYNEDLHSGDRMFIRKTGDSILCAVPPNFETAIAHQNLYVVKPRNKSFNLNLILGILSSKLLTFL